MSTRLEIVVEGKSDRLAARALVEALRNTVDVLRELEEQVSDNRRSTVQWDVAAIRMSSPLTLTLEARVRPQARDHSSDVVRGFLGGLKSLERRARPPAEFSDDALRKTREIISLLDDGVGRIQFSAPGGEPVTPTLHSAANIDEILRKHIGHYEEDGSIQGDLEVLSAHNGVHVDIWDVFTRSRVQCSIADELIEDAKAAFRRRVEVSGRVKYTRKGKPVSIQVESIRILRDQSELPQPTDFDTLKIDITGGVESSEYVRGLRDAD